MARPANAAYYEGVDLAAQAAILIAGVALGHPFFDANKRTATMAGATFLRMNGLRDTSGGDEFGRQVEALVLRQDWDADEATRDLAEWLGVHLEQLALRLKAMRAHR